MQTLAKKQTAKLNLARQKLSTEKRILSLEKQRQLDGMLIEAAKKGNAKRIERLLKAGANVNAIETERSSRTKGWTVLMFATANKHEKACRLLIENGADVNARIESEILRHKTALMLAANNGYIEICKLLIENGADVNARDDNTRTVLMEAVYGGYAETCRLLIRKGADIDAKIEDMGSVYKGWTALIRARRQEHGEIIELLERMESFSKLMGKESFKQFMLNFERCASQ